MIGPETSDSSLPIQCVFQDERKLFLVTRCKGKGLCMGGFGVPLLMDDVSSKDDKSKEASSQPPQEYLFIEEAIFLHERGLAEVRLYQNQQPKSAESYQLYRLLEPCGVEMAAYLVYAHIRSQSFRVLRHAPDRKRIWQEMQTLLDESEAAGSHKGTIQRKTKKKGPGTPVVLPNNKTSRLHQLKRQLRHAAASAPAPAVYQPANNNKTPPSATIAFDVYEPKANFSRNHPGQPAFQVVATCYNDTPSSLRFGDLQELLAQADGTALRIATVADAGTVIMFGVTDQGVPSIFHGGGGGGDECEQTANSYIG